MVTVSYPSQDFPAPLPIAIEIPQGWLAIHVPFTLIAARSSDAYEGFRPSVTVGWQRVASGTEPDDYVAQAGQVGASSYEGFELLEAKAANKDDVGIAAVRQRFDSGDGIPTYQEVLFVLGPETTERSRDLFQITATRHAADEASGATLTAILDSFTILDLTAVPDTDS